MILQKMSYSGTVFAPWRTQIHIYTPFSVGRQKLIHTPIASVRGYVGLLNGLFGMTPTELDVLAQFVELHIQLVHGGFQTNAFSTDGRRIVAKRLGRKSHNFLGSYVQYLKEKKAIYAIPGGYQIDPRLIPEKGVDEIVFRIKP